MKSTAKKRNSPRTRKQWQQLVEQFEASGLSIERYCKREKINLASLRKWRSQLKSVIQKPESVFIDVTPKQLHSKKEPADNGWAIELDIGEHITLRIRQSV